MTTTELPAVNVFTEGDRALADMIGLSQPNLEDLTHTQVHHLGNIVILGTNEEAPVMRFHTGPDDATKRGGTKFKFYSSEELQRSDGVDHSRSMFFKIGVVGGDGYAGGKTIAGVNHRALKEEQNIDAMRQTARLMHEAGLTDPRIDGTAGDEGTNGLIGYYVDELRALGHPHPEAAITGKADMRTRPSATGRGAAIVHRTVMKLNGEAETSAAVQGAGAAGAHYVAEAYDPVLESDREQIIRIPALGDIRVNEDKTVTPITLHTDHPEGLPITRRMVNSIMEDGGKHDRDMKEVGNHRLLALARKVERTGVEARISDKNVLTYDRAHCLGPAATSNVITPANINSIKAKRIHEIGNHTIHDDARPFLSPLGFEVEPGELVNAGGVKISIDENKRDLRKIHAEKTDGLYLPVSDEEYEAGLHQTMTASTRRVHKFSEAFGVDLNTATNAVGLASYAMTRDMQVSAEVRDMMLAA